MTVQEIFGHRLRQKRQELGLTQITLAKQVYTNNRAISVYESGKSSPSLDMLNLLADELEVSVDWLLGRTRKRN